MTILRFDETRSFDNNLEAFLNYMAVEDPELGAILRAHVSKLLEATDEGRRRAARSAFNSGVRDALDMLASAILEVSKK
jgi:hypothetical protein